MKITKSPCFVIIHHQRGKSGWDTVSGSCCILLMLSFEIFAMQHFQCYFLRFFQCRILIIDLILTNTEESPGCTMTLMDFVVQKFQLPNHIAAQFESRFAIYTSGKPSFQMCKCKCLNSTQCIYVSHHIVYMIEGGYKVPIGILSPPPLYMRLQTETDIFCYHTRIKIHCSTYYVRFPLSDPH